MAAPGPHRAHINDLPDDLLVCILNEVLRETGSPPPDISNLTSAPQRHAALVCRRWAALCNSSPAVASLTVHIDKSAVFMEHLRSFCGWLTCHGPGQVQRLRLSLQPAGEWQREPALSPAEWQELCTLLASALPACAGSLQELQMYLSGGSAQHESFPMASWLPRLGSQLHRLAVVSRQAELPISACLELLGGLAQLDVDCRLVFEPPGRLPAALTHLSLPFEYNIDALQPQMSTLTNLVELECCPFDYSPLHGLSALVSLRKLWIDCAAAPPSCLSLLTSLQRLTLTDYKMGVGEEQLEELRSALPQLHQLTALVIEVGQLAFPGSDDQAAFAACPQLVSLRFDAWMRDEPPCSLSGPWLQRLRRLAAPLHVIAGSWPALSSTATQLRQLGLHCDCEDDADLACQVAGWAEQHTTLQRLIVYPDDPHWVPDYRARLLHVQRRPTLCTHVCAWADIDALLSEHESDLFDR